MVKSTDLKTVWNSFTFFQEVEYSEENLEDLAEEFLFDDIFEKEQLCAILKG